MRPRKTVIIYTVAHSAFVFGWAESEVTVKLMIEMVLFRPKLIRWRGDNKYQSRNVYHTPAVNRSVIIAGYSFIKVMYI